MKLSILTRRSWALLFMYSLSVQLVLSQSIAPPSGPSKMDWWRKARLGMFIHWGVYAVPAGEYQGKDVPGLGEWIMHDASIPRTVYAGYAQQFNPVKYNPGAWVTMAKEAGMKYIVVTTKHHDGFALFDSKASDWTAVKATPYGKDLLKPLVDACRQQGMKLGFYYSQANDWYNPGGAAARGHWDKSQEGSMDAYIDKVAIPQMRELLTLYGDVVELWWDVPTDMNKERADKLHALLALQPGIITNDRLGGGYKGDITTPEQYIPATGIAGRDWETCMTMNDTWGFKTKDNNWKSSATLIRNLVDIASKGGNYLLNVGPTADGEFPAPIVERLAAIGRWTTVNGASVYGTTASPFKILPWGRATKRVEGTATTLYLHVFNWPADGQLIVPGLKARVQSVKLLAGGAPLKAIATADGVQIKVPLLAPDEVASVIEVKIQGAMTIEPYTVKQQADGRVVLGAETADIHNRRGGSSAMTEGGWDVRNIGYWTSASSWVSWNVVFSKAGTYTVKAVAGTPADVTAFTVQAGDRSLDGVVRKTGDYNQYAEVTLGTLTIDKPGKHTISLKPDQAGWKAMNLRQLVLQ